jgi:hypothetical protein
MESHFQITHLHPLWRAADLPPAAMHDYPKQLHAFNEEGSVVSDRQHQTDIFCTYKAVTAGPQKKHWVEFQLVDELGNPLANLPWRAVNQAVRDGCVPEYTGITDAEGVIRLENLYPLDMTYPRCDKGVSGSGPLSSRE